MHSHSIDDFRHSHVFLGEAHDRNERKTWGVIAICTVMMVAEIVGGWRFGSTRSLQTDCICPRTRVRFSLQRWLTPVRGVT